MKVVLINSPIYDRLEIESAGNEYLPPFGLGYLATKIQEKNWDVTILDTIQLGLNVTQVVQRLYEMEPDIIAINIFSVNIPVVRSILESYQSKAKFIVGGQCTNFIYNEIIKWNTNNELAVIIGEGDLIICDVIEDVVSEPPVYESKTRKVFQVHSSSKYFPADINVLPLNRGLLNEEFVVNYYGLKERAIITSRGCIYDCAFCGAAKSLNHNRKIRLKDKAVVLSEINDLIQVDPTVQCIRILDDLFLRSLQSIRDAIEIFSQFNVSWRAMAHIKTFENVPEELIVQMKKSGCVELFIGIESGSDKVRKMINKLGTVDEIKNTTRKILKCGIDIKGYFIFGFPLESESDMEMSFNVATTIYRYSQNSDGNFRTSVFQFRPYHGTALFNEFVEPKLELDYQENHILSTLIERRHFNIQTKNYSECDDKILYEFIFKTSNLGGKYDQGDNELQ
ncbi:radical SAM protein [Proteiniclasticum sp. SCR006]|uniref:Radical SAM protein n=1 Tax=Proteiniclasticum aestuarii TaxID=2817862 RepID=A0A939KJB4_9CLOT|nr:radical SAM protein [Proteiniclasticum aestuarii]MBO1264871.1 radical SAM protein [Proteiniclasticum aestuarii]